MVAVVFFGWLLWQGPWVLDRGHLSGTQPGPAAVVTGFRTAVVAAVAGLVAGAGLTYTDRTLRLTRSRDDDQRRIAEEGQITDRYSTAIKHLASNGVIEQLGGIFALERIMRDSQKDYFMVVEVLAAFVRERAPAPSEGKVSAVRGSQTPAGTLQAALMVLGRRPEEDEPYSVDLSGVDLRNAILAGARLDGAMFIDSHLQGSYLTGASLRGAHLWGADLTGTDLNDADLREVEGLTVEQVVAAEITSSTKLPDEISGAPQVQARIVAVEHQRFQARN
ncbi:pentapeptide repeat-containing protein [Streptomyces sp. NBC_01214]|uniref:pentapeptide repeat-containing protein n=1 Tax=Streptomyces sp. NBC_01214 TaxID=2903777 RepID=UPI002259EFBA|nr:pentapeptide repeat-containing protein [Streptomyces sp. NBC_01214]MCX4808759.1 pentapeptide repeat-containing protein [Streptomyces sp. NBC_01214]